MVRHTTVKRKLPFFVIYRKKSLQGKGFNYSDVSIYSYNGILHLN